MASSRCRRKRCRFCNQLFRPHPRLMSRQIACSKPACQSARKKANRKRWLADRPGYFTGRYANTKAWRQKRPDYQRRWRQAHPEVRTRDNARRQRRRELAALARAEIQNSISLQEPINKALTPHLVEAQGAEIQNSILLQVIALSIFSTRFAAHLERRDTRLDRQGSPAAL